MPSKTRTILRYLSPIRPWFPLVGVAGLRRDAFAGLTNAALVLPQGGAFALIAGLPPQYGLSSAIIVALVAAYWRSSRIMVSDRMATPRGQGRSRLGDQVRGALP